MTFHPFRTPRRFLRGSLVRLGLTIAALACGVALVGAIDLMNRAVYHAFVEIVDTMAGRAALQVTAGTGGFMPEEIAETVQRVDGVELAVPVVSSSAFTTDGSGEQLVVHGVDIANDDAVRVYEPADGSAPVLDDPLVFLNQPNSVMLTEQFAARHGLSIDDSIDLATPTGRRTFVVRGLLAPKGIARVQGGGIVLMDVAAAQRAFARPGLVNRVDVVLRRDADVPRVADAITLVLPPGLQVEAPEQRKVDLQRVMRSVQTLLSAVGLFGLAAAFLIAFSRLTNVFEARSWQLALLRAIGLRRRRVWWELTKESVLVGLAGIAIGIPLAILLGHALLPALATTTSIGSKLMVADATLAIRPPSLLLASGLGLVAAIFAAALPAARAAQVPVAETLRRRGAEQSSSEGWSAGIVRLTVVLLAIGVTLLHLGTGTAASGLLTTSLVVLVGAMLPRVVLERLARPLTRLAPRVAGATGRFAVATLLHNPRRTALTIATLGVGFGTVLWLWTLARSFEDSVVSVMPGVLRGDLAVSSANVGAGYVEAPLDDAILDELARISGVEGVVGEQAVDWPFKDGPVAINAFDPSYFVDPRFGTWQLMGRSLPGAFDAVSPEKPCSYRRTSPAIYR